MCFYREIDEKVYEAYVKEKKEAKEDYMQAINAGQTAAHVEQKWVYPATLLLNFFFFSSS